jgi:hypothetical protein
MPEDVGVEDMEVDQPVASGSDEDGERFRQKVENAERSFLGFADRRLFLQRVNRSVLQQMCQNRGLSNLGTKAELYANLEAWVNSPSPTARPCLMLVTA